MHDKVLGIISRTLGVPQDSIKPEDRLVDLAPDSIKLFELLIAFEKEFDRQVDYREVASIETVAQVFAYIEKLGISA